MAEPRNRKRQQIPELSQSNPPPKKAKLKRESNFSPVFWDNLSKIWLTPCALRELNRRNSAYTLPILPEVYPTDLARFARHGGPDLCHLRGYSEPKKDIRSYLSSTSRSRQTNSTAATSVTSNTPNESNIPFTNLISLTDESTVQAVPDSFDGAKASDLHSVVRRELNELVIPTKHANVPIIPNFFLEAKGPSGSVSVAEKQACYDGAHGARAMHALQNYKLAEPTYDGNAYTYSSTYHDGTLKLYAHHVTAPTMAEERPEYHMTQIDGWQMTGSIDSFRRGATAFRNARDSAKRHRDSFIQAANARTVKALAVILEDPVERHEETSDHPEMPEMQRPKDCSAHTGRKDADQTLRQQIAEDRQHALQDDTGAVALAPQYLYTQRVIHQIRVRN
ncbi:hypothetical protein H634G_09306 [Metarhizium anisopliae BRIP 53293]|uniref:DUF7924 domain-containing protein n=1 Tax=Metarhizium anisopliae BRIP 53293 TaxID=1291518 RepID=A0A0D9NNE3_METAN|nr:hypothetical protein H634G_09306 [Metarhizium anisopliae BRIP 53293]KJK87341.1 hypothetical protein H633G_08797 [Metarhizium anisopliae BRIP 53284]